MKNNPDIVILAKPGERADNLIFLFRLSNFKLNLISDDNEAFNYLVQRQQGISPASLLVIIEATQHLPFLDLLDKLDRCGAMLPILLVHDNNPIATNKFKCRAQLLRLIQQCPTVDSHTYIRRTLPSYPATHSQVAEKAVYDNAPKESA